VDLGVATVRAIADWLEARGSCAPDSPLFIALDSAHSGHRLSGDGICKMVVRHSEKAGINKKQMSPHRIRHSAIAVALDATDGDVRKVQKFSRHRNLNTLMVYDDNRGRDQQDVTEMLDSMF